MTAAREELERLAEHHEAQGVLFAKQATSNATWKHDHAQDVRRAADHFAIAAALRAQVASS